MMEASASQKAKARRETGGQPLWQASTLLHQRTAKPGFVDITAEVAGWLTDVGAGDGTVTLFIRHTSASLTVQENADPDVQLDLCNALEQLAPQASSYRHATEGPDDMPAHIRTMLTNVSVTVPVQAGSMMLGTWQAIYLIEHRARPHDREIVLKYIGD